jgi:hypothetical protein
MSGAEVYQQIVASPVPDRAVAELSDDELEALIEELWLVRSPNNFQATVYAMAMNRVLYRWKNLLRQE